MYRSHRTQEILNYFDHCDVRTRQGKTTIEAQLINAICNALDHSELRITREINGRTYANVPLNIDNQGVYYRVQVPNTFQFDDAQKGPSVVEGSNDGNTWTGLYVYDDRLPIQTGLVIDTTRQSVPASDLTVATCMGNGSPQTLVPGLIGTPNRISFYMTVSGDLETQAAVTVRFQGTAYPSVLWLGEARTDVETISLSSAGLYQTTKIWSDWESITVDGLPATATINFYLFPFQLQLDRDPERTFTHCGPKCSFWDAGAKLLFKQSEKYLIRVLSEGLYQKRKSAYLMD